MIIPADVIQQLIKAAQNARELAYAPYSHYQVGAALLTDKSVIYTGCNVENATYGATICAERTALVKAVSDGVRHFHALVVVTDNGGSPCGICRQMLFEFAPELMTVMANATGQIVAEYPLDELLVRGFGPSNLKHPTQKD